MWNGIRYLEVFVSYLDLLLCGPWWFFVEFRKFSHHGFSFFFLKDIQNNSSPYAMLYSVNDCIMWCFFWLFWHVPLLKQPKYTSTNSGTFWYKTSNFDKKIRLQVLLKVSATEFWHFWQVKSYFLFETWLGLTQDHTGYLNFLWKTRRLFAQK